MRNFPGVFCLSLFCIIQRHNQLNSFYNEGREGETFARATVFTLEHHLLHLCKKKNMKKKVIQKRHPEEQWPALVDKKRVRNRHVQQEETTSWGTWAGGWLWTYPQLASLTFTKCYHSISAELAAGEHRSDTPSQQVGEQCWKAARGSDTKRIKKGKPPRTKPQSWELLERLHKPKHRFSDFLFRGKSSRASRAIAP